MNMTKKPNR